MKYVALFVLLFPMGLLAQPEIEWRISGGLSQLVESPKFASTYYSWAGSSGFMVRQPVGKWLVFSSGLNLMGWKTSRADDLAYYGPGPVSNYRESYEERVVQLTTNLPIYAGVRWRNKVDLLLGGHVLYGWWNRVKMERDFLTETAERGMTQDTFSNQDLNRLHWGLGGQVVYRISSWLAVDLSCFQGRSFHRPFVFYQKTKVRHATIGLRMQLGFFKNVSE